QIIAHFEDLSYVRKKLRELRFDEGSVVITVFAPSYPVAAEIARNKFVENLNEWNILRIYPRAPIPLPTPLTEQNYSPSKFLQQKF
ncbi:hypothetical protein E4U16_000948, partial [Claviceps sp. LM84 group G4]